MRTASILAVAVATGGILLGTMLGSAAAPDMKDPPAPWWQRDEDQGTALQAQSVQQTHIERASPFGGYRPDLDYAAEAWSSPLPEYELAPLSDSRATPFAFDATGTNFDPVGAEGVADEAEAAANEAAAAAAPGRTNASSEIRKSELAKSGLY